MKDILTRLTFALGNKMAENETNELCEAKTVKSPNWKYDVVVEFITTHIDEQDVCKKAAELASALNVDNYEKEETAENHWKKLKDLIKSGFKVKPEEKKAAKTVRKSVSSYKDISSYGCGSSSNYGCGGSSRRESYRSYGCGGSSRSYGC